MFGIGFVEICIIAVVAIVFVGPKKLPEMMKHVGKFFVQARKMSNEVKSTFDNVVKEAEQEMHLDNLKKIKELTKGALTNPLVELNDEINKQDDNHQDDNHHDDGHGDGHHDNNHHADGHQDSDEKSAANDNAPLDSQPHLAASGNSPSQPDGVSFANIEENQSASGKKSEADQKK